MYKQHAADDGEAEDAENDSEQAEIEPHVAVQDVAELVGDDALQFIARQQFHAAARDGDGGIAGGVAGGEGVDALLLVHHIDLRHGHAGGERHFLDDVQQLALVEVRAVRIQQPPAHHGRNRAAALGEFHRF